MQAYCISFEEEPSWVAELIHEGRIQRLDAKVYLVFVKHKGWRKVIKGDWITKFSCGTLAADQTNHWYMYE